MRPTFTIVGIGEALLDVFPDRQVLGGAPLNVAIHAHALASPLGGRGVVLSRVGQDEAGRLVLNELASRGVDNRFIQTDPDHGTGRVYVLPDDHGGHRFEIAPNAAWDWLSFDPEDEDLARNAQAVCFGTLAQRNAQARNAIYRFLDAARGAVRLLDVNLRQDFFDQRIIARSCERATALKLNDEELPIVSKLLGLDTGEKAGGDWIARQAQALLKKYNFKMVVVTRGPKGTVIHTPDGAFEGAAASYEPIPGADAVGAGDACSAAILLGLVRRWPMQRTADLANRCGAYVASVPGATPTLPADILALAGD